MPKEPNMTAALIASLQHIRNFLFGGEAIFTLVSKKTGERKTFRVERAADADKPSDAFQRWFVSLLVGPENTTDYRYLGLVFQTHTKGLAFKVKNQGGFVEACQSISWLLRKLESNDQASFDAQAEFWHAGYCSRCGRLLTDPESIACGLGPVCREKFAGEVA
jgi:hypothetical protein